MNTKLGLPSRKSSLDSQQSAVKMQQRAVVMLFCAAQINQYDRGKNVFSNNLTAHKISECYTNRAWCRPQIPQIPTGSHITVTYGK